MRFLKTLQKKQIEQPIDIEAVDNLAPQGMRAKHGGNNLPEVLAEPDLRIGTPNPAYNKQPDSFTDNFDFETANVGAADLDASVLKKPVKEKRLAEITIDAERINSHLVAITQPDSPYCEEYRSLRTRLLHKSQKQNLQSIVISSVGPSEGKSITALNLSWLLAQTSGISALVIDSDLRMSSLTDYLAIETETGLSEVLEGNISLRDSIVRLEPAGLHLLSGGRARSDVAELISGAKFKEILRQACEMFDYVIIDAPPLGVFSDASVLINHADGALLVVRANYTPYKDIERVLEALPREKMLGTILNHSEDGLTRENYYNYGYYKKGGQ